MLDVLTTTEKLSVQTLTIYIFAALKVYIFWASMAPQTLIVRTNELVDRISVHLASLDLEVQHRVIHQTSKD
jgi:hypothetical protein